MTITHRIARAAERDISRQERTAQSVRARNEEVRESYRAAAREVWPPVTPEQKKAVLDLYAKRPSALSSDVILRETYGIGIVEFLRVLNKLRTDMDVVPGNALECNRLTRIANRRVDARAARRAS